MNFYNFHIGDYVKAAGHLTWEEDAALRVCQHGAFSWCDCVPGIFVPSFQSIPGIAPGKAWNAKKAEGMP